MLDIAEPGHKIEVFRASTQAMVAQEHFPDDNNLLAYLKAAGYLADDTLSGYLAAAMFSFSKEPGAAEFMIDTPMGERALVVPGGPNSGYASPHENLRGVKVSGRVLHTDTGHVVETDTGSRHFLPKELGTVDTKIRQGLISHRAVDEECRRLGLDRIRRSSDFVSDEYIESYELTFTRAIRYAASWASYTLRKPRDAEARAEFSRTLTVNESQLCLKAALQNSKQKTPKNDTMIIREVIGSL